MFKYIFLVVLVVFTGCAPKQEFVEKKVYKGYSKDAILEASKKVFFLADKNREFKVDSYRNKVEVRKRKFYHYFVDVGVYVDKWTLDVIEEENQTRVLLALSRIDTDTNKEMMVEKGLNTEVFWNRVDYILGKNNKWDTCLGKFSLFTNDALLCDMGVLSNQEPKMSDIIKNPLIEHRPKTVYSVDTIDADIYKFTDLTIKKNKEDILEPAANINNTDTLDPILDNNALENEAKSQESPINENGEKELQKLKDEMNFILENKQDLDDIKVNQIIDNQEIKENSEFILDDASSTSEEKLNKLDKIENK